MHSVYIYDVSKWNPSDHEQVNQWALTPVDWPMFLCVRSNSELEDRGGRAMLQYALVCATLSSYNEVVQ